MEQTSIADINKAAGRNNFLRKIVPPTDGLVIRFLL